LFLFTFIRLFFGFNDIKILAERACRDMMICDLLRPVVLLFAEVCCFVICWDLFFCILLIWQKKSCTVSQPCSSKLKQPIKEIDFPLFLFRNLSFFLLQSVFAISE